MKRILKPDESPGGSIKMLDDIVKEEVAKAEESGRSKALIYEKPENDKKTPPYGNSYLNQTHLNIHLTGAQLAPLGEGLYGIHFPEIVKTLINENLRSDVCQRYRTEIHERLHEAMHTSSEYVVRTLETFISGLRRFRSRYEREPQYIF